MHSLVLGHSVLWPRLCCLGWGLWHQMFLCRYRHQNLSAPRNSSKSPPPEMKKKWKGDIGCSFSADLFYTRWCWEDCLAWLFRSKVCYMGKSFSLNQAHMSHTSLVWFKTKLQLPTWQRLISLPWRLWTYCQWKDPFRAEHYISGVSQRPAETPPKGHVIWDLWGGPTGMHCRQKCKRMADVYMLVWLTEFCLDLF